MGTHKKSKTKVRGIEDPERFASICSNLRDYLRQQHLQASHIEELRGILEEESSELPGNIELKAALDAREKGDWADVVTELCQYYWNLRSWDWPRHFNRHLSKKHLAKFKYDLSNQYSRHFGIALGVLRKTYEHPRDPLVDGLDLPPITADDLKKVEEIFTLATEWGAAYLYSRMSELDTPRPTKYHIRPDPAQRQIELWYIRLFHATGIKQKIAAQFILDIMSTCDFEELSTLKTIENRITDYKNGK